MPLVPHPNPASSRPAALAESAPSDLERGIAALRAYLGDGESLLETVPLRQGEIASFEFPLPLDFLGQQRALEIGFPDGFPRAQLRVRVRPNAWLQWPHVMRDGVCLYADARPLSGMPKEVVNSVMSRVYALVRLALPSTSAAERQAEFEREITTYWAQQLTRGPTQLVLIEAPHTASPLWVVSDQRSRAADAPASLWLAADRRALEALAKRAGNHPGKLRRPVSAGFLLPLSTYPSLQLPTAEGLVAWLEPAISTEALGALRSWMASTSALPERHLVLAMDAHDASPRSFVAITLRNPQLRPRSSPVYGKRAASRAAREPAGGRWTLQRSGLHVLSEDSVHSRNLGSAKALRDKHVVLVGVGSLGSQVAYLLARAGVGQLTLIDPDTLEAANLGRHVLGFDDLGRYKAHALRDRLMHDVPTVQVAAFATYAQTGGREVAAAILESDLVVVTTADWGSELALWEIKTENARWGLIQAWSEPYSVAGHALVVPSDCAADGAALFSSNGVFAHPITSGWTNAGFVDLPQCGSRFIPAGPIGLAAVGTMVANAAAELLEGRIDQPSWIAYFAGPEALARARTRADAVLTPGTRPGIEQRAWPGSAVVAAHA